MSTILKRVNTGRRGASFRWLVNERVLRRTVIGVLAVLVILNTGELSRRVQFWSTGAVKVDGLTFCLNPDDEFLTQQVLEEGTWEPEETRLILEQLRPGDTVVDVGANVGWYTVLASRAVGPDGLVIAFEPDPINFAILKRNIDENGCRNVRLEQKALSNEPGSITLFLHKSNKGMHSLLSFDDNERSIDVEAIRLDDYLHDHVGSVDLVKIDVEGAEGFVLEGMGATLAKNPEMSLLLEFVPERLAVAGYDPETILSELAERGFRFQEVVKQTGLRPAVGVADLLVQLNREGRAYTNLFVSRESASTVD